MVLVLSSWSRGRAPLIAFSALFVLLPMVACNGDDEPRPPPVTDCAAPPPPAEALRAMGSTDGAYLLPDGRAVTPAGIHAVLGGFPSDVRAHPTLPLAYVANTGYALRSLQVVDVESGDIVQEIPRTEGFYGLAIAADGSRLYAAGGVSRMLEVYDIDPAGLLVAAAQVDVESDYPAGMALSADGTHLWVGTFLGFEVIEIDTATLAIADRMSLPFGAYSLAVVPQTNELYVTGFRSDRVAVVDLASMSVATTITLPSNPQSLAVMPDGTRVFVTVSDAHDVVAIDAASHEVVATQSLDDPGVADAEGVPLPGSSPSGIALDAAGEQLYVLRAGDNSVAVLDAATLEPAGAIPVGWYPTAATLADGGTRLVVTNGKGVGTGPLTPYTFDDESGKAQMAGSISLVDLGDIDLAALTDQVEENMRRPDQVYPFECPGSFPVPTSPGGLTPIQHIVLVVRENKTYDTLLGDLEGADGDPDLALFGEDITPNLHALARRFTHHDNFYNDSENSTQGHLWLTSSFVNDYMERTWIEDFRGNGDFEADPATEAGQPDFGTFFTHLIKHGVNFWNFGEVTGSFGEVDGQTVIDHTDLGYPGIFFNLVVPDETKANYVADRLVVEGDFPPFVFVLLPRDHTYGTNPDEESPESMINDNDVAAGVLVDRISHSPYWESTAIFIVEDDPQIGGDHVDYHRSICVIASPWAKRGHVSHVHTSFPSLFRTFELILGLPPMNRYDALATPFWDAFAQQADLEPYTALPRTVLQTMNRRDAAGADWSRFMDFRGPDRNPDLGEVLWWYRKGAPRPGSRLARAIARGLPPGPLGRERDDDDDDGDVEEGLRRVERYLAAHPDIAARWEARRALWQNPR